MLLWHSWKRGSTQLKSIESKTTMDIFQLVVATLYSAMRDLVYNT